MKLIMAIQRTIHYAIDERAPDELKSNLLRYLRRGGNPDKLPSTLRRHFEYDGRFFSMRTTPFGSGRTSLIEENAALRDELTWSPPIGRMMHFESLTDFNGMIEEWINFNNLGDVKDSP